MSPDGRFFDNQLDARFHTEDILLESKTYENNIVDLSTDASALVKRIIYPVTQFSVSGSESKAMTFLIQFHKAIALLHLAKVVKSLCGQYVKGELLTRQKIQTYLSMVRLHFMRAVIL